MMTFFNVLLLLCVLLGAYSCTVTNYLTNKDQTNLKNTLISLLDKQIDLETSYYTVTVFDLFQTQGELVKYTSKICSLLKSYEKNTEELSIQDGYYFVWLSNKLKCHEDIQSNIVQEAKKIVEKEDFENISDLKNAIEILKINNIPIENRAQIIHSIEAFLKNNASCPKCYGQAFNIASNFRKYAGRLSGFIEDTLEQVDEVQANQVTWLQFDGGLSVTSVVFDGIMKLATSLNDSYLPINQKQADMFANYLLSRKSVKTAKGIYSLFMMAFTLADSPISPISVTNQNSIKLRPNSPTFTVKVCDLLGRPIKKLVGNQVVANSIVRNKDQAEILSKLSFKSVPNDSTHFLLDSNIEPGHYKVFVSVKNSATIPLTMIVQSEIKIDSFYIDVVHPEQDRNTIKKLDYPNELNEPLNAESNKKLFVRLKLSHSFLDQVILRFEDILQNHEFIVAIPRDSNNEYSYELTIKSFIKKHKIDSKDYNIELIIGDIVISNPIDWRLGSISFDNFQNKNKVMPYKPLNEIHHKFRDAEKRPPPIVSIVFTGLCLVPILILFTLWYRIGVNLKQFKVNVYAILFHVSIAAILGLFVIFWFQLNMFTTCKYLLGLAGICFISGNQLLKSFN